MHVDEVGFVNGGDARFEDFRADEFADRHCCCGVVWWCEVLQDRADDSCDYAAASGIPHAEGVRAEEHDGFEDFGGT